MSAVRYYGRLDVYMSMKSTNKQFTVAINSFESHHGGQSGQLFVRCSLYGQMDTPVVVVLGGISANHLVSDDHATGEKGWWSDVVNSKEYLNGEQVSVLSFEYITLNNKHLKLSTHDQAHVLSQIQQKLKLNPFLAVIGCSYGGMVAQAFASTYPHLTQRLICLVAAHRNSIRSQTLRSLQRQIVALSGHNNQGLALARGLAMTTYRGLDEFDQRFSQLEEADAYLKHHGQRFVSQFSPERFVQLSASIDDHQINPDDIISPTLLIAIDSDQLVPVSLVQEMANGINAPCQLHILPSRYGHDGFLKELTAIKPLLANFLSEQQHDSTNFQHSRHHPASFNQASTSRANFGC